MADEKSTQARPPPRRDALDIYAHTINNSQLLKSLNAVLSFPDPADRILVRVDPILPFQRGGLGTAAVNGGMLAAMFDFVIGTTPALIDPTRRTATMQLSITFERPVMGDWFTAEGWVDRAGESTVFSSGEIKDERGTVCSRCTGLVKMSKMTWTQGWQPSQ
jgi:acyl-coenzyme A thioesterase PaaI-like protein